MEESSKILSQEKDSLFDELQLKQAELESSNFQLEALQGQVTEFQYQLRETSERLAIAQEELTETRRGGTMPTRSASSSSLHHSMSSGIGGAHYGGGSIPSSELSSMLSEAESRYEARLADLRSRMRSVELERAEAEEVWSRTLQLRAEDVEKVKRLLEKKETEVREALERKRERDGAVQSLEGEIERQRRERDGEKRRVGELGGEIEDLRETLVSHSQEPTLHPD